MSDPAVRKYVQSKEFRKTAPHSRASTTNVHDVQKMIKEIEIELTRQVHDNLASPD
jgi:hypothetical protein